LNVYPASDVSRIAYREFYLALREIFESAEERLLERSAKEEAEGRAFDDVRVYLELYVADLER
jgi:hypothetical protein